MTKNKKENDKRIEFKLSDFFVDKLFLKDETLFFGSNNKLKEVLDLININLKEAKQILKIKNIFDDYILNDNQIAELALFKNMNFERINDVSETNVLEQINLLLKDELKQNAKVEIAKRNPIVTIMGHVDHGKTTLLDVIRKSNNVKGEVGGITQKIGAYQAQYKDQKITFIDTPGHEAFTKMRANGAKVTDIVVIVVAADDSIMPQTRESIDHAKAANVPIIIAVNKMDRPGASSKNVKNELAGYDLISEEWGGNVKVVEISALKNKNIDKLLQAIIDTAKTLDLKVPFNTLASGTVIESNVSKNRGNLVDVIVLSGQLQVGDSILIDGRIVKVKSLNDEHGQSIKVVTPSVPVEIYGIGFSPEVGSNFVVVKDKEAQRIAQNINLNKDSNKSITNKIDPFSLFNDKLFADKKIINLIIKTDTLGMLSAIVDKINSFENDEVEVRVLRKDVGEITNSDILLAEASDALIYQFNLSLQNSLKPLIKNKNIEILSFDIIYKLFEDLEEKIKGKIPKKYSTVKIGEAEVLKTFSISKIGTIAGSMIKQGMIKSNSIVKLYRNDKLIHEGEVSSLKIQKNNVKQVKKGFECGIMIKDFNDILPSDKIEIFEKVEQKN